MYKMIAYWSAPAADEREAFEKHYADVHLPRARAVPHLLRLSSTLTSDALGSPEPHHYRVAEMGFESREAFALSAQSQAWSEMLACSAEMCARFGVRLTAEAGAEVVFEG
jgi:uncharacterized protein (TIGR02118 family)